MIRYFCDQCGKQMTPDAEGKWIFLIRSKNDIENTSGLFRIAIKTLFLAEGHFDYVKIDLCFSCLRSKLSEYIGKIE